MHTPPFGSTHDISSSTPPFALDTKSTRSPADVCPACENSSQLSVDSEKESWVRCDACRVWFHWRCVSKGGDLDLIDKWYCDSCRNSNPLYVITVKPPARKSMRKKTVRDYADLHSGVNPSDTQRWSYHLETRQFAEDKFRRMTGSEVTQDWLENDPTAMTEPIVINLPEGLGMKMPDGHLTVNEIAEIIGRDNPVEVIDVSTQSNLPGWTLGKWADYYSLEPVDRDKIRNVISLEISGSKLAEQVLPPRLVREVDWVERFWPSTKRGRGHIYPKVQLYCLMGVAGAWTDWHVDFAGSSVYYHVLRGSKVFYLVRPSSANLAAYERWSGTEMQCNTWLGDIVDVVTKVVLTGGNTMIIPTGWIHAVYTPEDTLVFGGNFLHSYNAAIQLRIRDIEISTHVPKKFRFPMFAKLSWYVGERYMRDLKAKEEFSDRVLDSLQAIAGFLVSEARMIERGPEAAKKEAKEQIPNDRVKDPSALARELRWRVRLAAGYESEGETHGLAWRRQKGFHSHARIKTGQKRGVSASEDMQDTSTFRNFQPRSWEDVEETTNQSTAQVAQVKSLCEGDAWKDNMKWRGVVAELAGVEEESVVEVHRSRRVIVKFRRMADGIERQRVESTTERWVRPIHDQSQKREENDAGI